MKKTFYLIDGHSQIYRAYYAPFNPLTAPSGEPVKATVLFTQMLLALLRDRRPDYLAMAMDAPDAISRRLETYAEYKANREKTPEDFVPQLQRIVQIVEILGIPIFQLGGYEADDLLATLVEKARPEGLQIRIVSRDKDLHQLLSEDVLLWDPQKDELIDPASLERDLGFTPEQAVEVQTLSGDSTDNVPGIPGVGLKTAASLIRKYGSADEVVAHADELTPKLRENVLAFADRLAVTRKLVTLDRAAPVDLYLEACRVKPIPFGRLRPLFQELNLRRLLEQLDDLEAASKDAAFLSGPEATSPSPGVVTLTTTTPGRYSLIDTEEAFEEFLARLSRQEIFAVDTETTSTRCVDCDLVGVSFSWAAGEGHYIPLRSMLGKTLDPARVLPRLQPILEDPKVRKIGQNIKFDSQVLRGAGIRLRGIAFDTMVASYLLRPEGRAHDLDTLSLEYLGHKKIPITDLLGRGKDQVTMLEVETRLLADYSGEDADMTWRLWEVLSPRIESSPMRSLFHEVELPLVDVLADMEYQGIRIDSSLLESLCRSMEARIAELREKVYAAAGRKFLIDSPKQLAEILFDELGLRVVKTTKTSRSTDADVLATLWAESDHPLPKLVLEYRELSKLRSTYIEPLSRMVSPRTSRLHASFHQTVAATGRLSSSDPNLQNIPIRTSEGKEIRRAFLPRDGDHVLITADYSQIELRVLAHLSGDGALLEAFKEGRDIHAFVASQVAGVTLDQVTREQRSKAKAVSFGIIYGQGAFGLSRALGIGQKEAAEFIAAYKKRYPGVLAFIEECISRAQMTGKATTLLGRQRAIPEIQSRNRARRALGERLAVNTVVQGTAADMIKVAMVRVHRRIEAEGLPARILIQVHDELVLEARREITERVAALLREEMEGALPLKVPLRVDLGWGENWLEAKGD